MNKKNIITFGVAGVMLCFASLMYATTFDDVQQKTEERVGATQSGVGQSKTRIEAAQENVQQRIGQLKDRQKQVIAKKINTQFSHVNEVRADHFTNVLARLEDILQKIKSRSDKAAAKGKDVSAATIAIENAETKIAAARAVVDAQAQKTYVIDITKVSEASGTTDSQKKLIQDLREQFKDMRNQLFSDLTLIRDGSLQDARSSVKEAFQALSNVPKVDED